MNANIAWRIALSWMLAAFLQAVNNRIGLIEPNFFLIFANLLMLRSAHPSLAYIYVFFGFTCDAFTSSLFGVQAISFFLTAFPALFLGRLLDHDAWPHLFLYGLALGLIEALLSLGVMMLFEGISFWLFFAKKMILVDLLPEAALTAALGVLLAGAGKKF